MTPVDEFGDLTAAHQVAVRRYATRRVPLSDVEDVVAEVFTVAWRHRDRLPDRVDLWLLRAARNVIAHHYRSEQRRRRLAARLHAYGDPDQYAADPADAGSDAGRALIAALARLSDSDQELLRLTYWEQLSTSEVAVVVECSPAAARVRVHRARRRLIAVLPVWLHPRTDQQPKPPIPVTVHTDTPEVTCDA